MKRSILAGALMVTATLCGNYYSWAAAAERPGPGMAEGPGRGQCAKMPLGNHVDHMAKMLGLSETQQKQIKAIMKDEHEKNATLKEKMGEYRKQLQAAEQAVTFDDAAVRAIAARQAQAGMELTVSRARTQHRINAVLTPEQRVLEQKLRASRGPGPGHPPPFHDEL